ncbi:MAG: type I-E CRISPR-associated protein Cse1/CasA [Chloroflexota bacterium]
MSNSFNLVDQKWIPCLHIDGHIEDLSLLDALAKAHQLRGIHGDSPLETASLYRLLLAVIHSAMRGPRRKSDWSRLWVAENFDMAMIEGYLNKWRDRFDLFHPQRPFYQVGDERAKTKSVISLVFDMASGHNAALFDHHTEGTGVSLQPSNAARALITVQNFGLAGLFLSGSPFTDGPWSRGILFFLEGENLYKTLVLNLLPYPDDEVRPTQSNDQPAWEKDNPFEPERQIPLGYLDYLTWQSRRILLKLEDDQPVVRTMTMAPGLRLDGSIQDPMKAYRHNEEKEFWMSMRFTEDRSMWRDSGSFLGIKNIHGIPPQPFSWLVDRLDEPGHQKFQLMAFGMANDQAKVEFFREEHLPLSLRYLENENLIADLRQALDLSERTRFSLRYAVQGLALLVVSPKSDGKKWKEVDRISRDQAEKLTSHWNTERSFWQHLEIPFLNLIGNLPENPTAMFDWNTTLRETAWQCLEKAVSAAGTDPNSLKAAVRARGVLRYSLKELFPEIQKEATT